MKRFYKISVLYGIALAVLTAFFYAFYDSLFYKSFNPFFTFIASIYVMDLIYFQFLQVKVKRVHNPPISTLSAICLMVGLVIGTIIYLTLGKSEIQPSTIVTFFPVFLIITVWSGKKLWLKKSFVGS